jgi:hypothetical protein
MFVRGKTFQPSLTFANDAKCDTWKGYFLANTYLTMVNSSFNIWPSIIAWLRGVLKSPVSLAQCYKIFVRNFQIIVIS